jgi:hypothetical protein
MKGFCKASEGSSIPIHYNGSVEASKQRYSKGSEGPFITVHYNGSVDASRQGYKMAVRGR